MKLVALISRHGETVLNKNKAYRSWLDVPLNEQGTQQAKAAAKFVSKYPVKAVVSSPLLRAFVTAEMAGKNFDLTPIQHRGLLPWHLGFFAGMNREDHNDALRLFVKNPEVVIPNGESLEHFEDRQFTFWDAALKMARKIGLTLFVCHTSNVVCLEKFCLDEPGEIEPEQSESVKPGGVAGVYWDGKSHKVEPIFGKTEDARFGGS